MLPYADDRGKKIEEIVPLANQTCFKVNDTTVCNVTSPTPAIVADLNGSAPVPNIDTEEGELLMQGLILFRGLNPGLED